MAAKSALEVSCRRLGGLLELLERFDMPEERLPGTYGALLDASWGALGGLRAPQKVIGNGSWTARGHRGHRFQHAWGPRLRPKKTPGGSQIGVPKRSELKMAKP